MDNALRLLLMLRDGGSVRLSSCAEQLGVARSTAHRLLAMLRYHEFVQQDPTDKSYRAGPALVGLGLAAVLDLDIRVRARPHMERLAAQVEETVNLIVLEGAACRFVDAVESPRALRVGGRIGLQRSAHCTSGGKALLATLSTEELHALFPDEALPVVTERTIRTRTALEQELAVIRERGYSINAGESDPELSAVGVALRDSLGRIEGALGIAAPTSRLSDARIQEIVDAALAAAAAIAAPSP